ncbi:hypothetical protein K9M79_04665 [Candidatus Woesearchaeota archaeon]|nr:hypothetical protein [Candidatus Woesearchaeota archaeon]
MKGFLRDLFSKNDSILGHSIIIFIGFAVGSVLNYLYQIIVVRSLNPAEYSIFSSLYALVFIILYGGYVIEVVATKYTSSYYAKRDYQGIKGLLQLLNGAVLKYGMIALVVFVMCSGIISDYLKIDSLFLIFLVGIWGFSSTFMPIYSGILSGLQRFLFMVSGGVSIAVTKVILLLAFIYFGLNMTGPFYALIISQAVISIIYYFKIKSELPHRSRKINKISIAKNLPYFTIAAVVPTVLINIDVILVKHFFDASSAGMYGAASLLAKMIFFASWPFIVVILPKATKRHTEKQNTRELLKSAMLYTIVIGGCGIGAYYLFPDLIISTLFGSQYLISGLIGKFGIAILILCLVQVLANYNLAKNKFGFSYILAAFGVIEVVLIMLFHSSLDQVVNILIITFSALFVSLAAFSYFQRERSL